MGPDDIADNETLDVLDGDRFEDVDVESDKWDVGKTPHELLGEVNGTAFLKQLSVEVLQAQQKRLLFIFSLFKICLIHSLIF